MAVMVRPAVSVVASCFDEEEVLPLFLNRIGGVLDSLGGTSELVLVDDGSRDRTWEIIEKAAVKDARVVGGTEGSASATGSASQRLIPPALVSV